MLQMRGIRSEALKAKVQKVRIIKSKALDEVRFFRSWIENPLKTGAVSPSGPALASKMASYLQPIVGRKVVELGPGTGAVTKAIFDRGIRHKDMIALEYSRDFCRLLQARYPGLDVLEGDAYALKTELESHLGSESGGLDFTLGGIVSSLPLLTRPDPVRERLLKDALELLRPGDPFIQFSYSLAPPVRPGCGTISLTHSDWIWRNLPPARVWVYRKLH